jgi:tRNA pseudouridine synthase 10
LINESFSYKDIDDRLAEALSGRICSLLKGCELSSFMVGCSFPSGLEEERKKQLRKDFQFGLIHKIKTSLSASPSSDSPEAMITVDLNRGLISIWLKPLYISGRYRKFSRMISQTVFYCPECKGRGCGNCSGRGIIPFRSVQELVAAEAIPFFGASNNSFHGSGREDLDVRMLGAGREFVIEIKEPRRRNADLSALEERINSKNTGMIEVLGLGFCEKAKIAEIKERKRSKVYSFLAEAADVVSEDVFGRIGSKSGRDIVVFQRTPERVSESRTDTVRRRKVKILKAERVSEDSLRIEAEAEHGLYIKEFVSSDSTRTKPSLSSIAGVPLSCRELDVIAIL